MAILGRHPAILGSAVLGRSHPEKGEDPFAFVMLRPEYKGRVTPEDLSRWCGENMAVYKVPTFKIMEELPLTATGKVKKEELRNQVVPYS
jgi:acyl-CoA synthetase (AMP-forming)/AMP-acid ligase II